MKHIQLEVSGGTAYAYANVIDDSKVLCFYTKKGTEFTLTKTRELYEATLISLYYVGYFETLEEALSMCPDEVMYLAFIYFGIDEFGGYFAPKTYYAIDSYALCEAAEEG